MDSEISQKCSKIIPDGSFVHSDGSKSFRDFLFGNKYEKFPFNFTVFAIFTAVLPAAGLLLSLVHQSMIIALGSILGFWLLIYFCLWLMCAVDCFQEKDGTGFLLLLLIPVIGMILVVAARER